MHLGVVCSAGMKLEQSQGKPVLGPAITYCKQNTNKMATYRVVVFSRWRYSNSTNCRLKNGSFPRWGVSIVSVGPECTGILG